MTKEELKRLRKEAELTQEQLARDLEVTVYTVISWENGRNPIVPITERAIRAYFAEKTPKPGKNAQAQ
jgi:DNA-binding XRE family transcriptional regulator